MHELVPRRVVLDPVGAIAKTVMREQFGRELIGQAGSVLDGFISSQLAQTGTFVGRPRGMTLDRGKQRNVIREGVESCGRCGLVVDFVRGERKRRCAALQEWLDRLVHQCSFVL